MGRFQSLKIKGRLLFGVCLFAGFIANAWADDIFPSHASCKQKFSEVVSQHHNFEDATKAWEQCRHFCPQDGRFEKYQVAIFGKYRSLEEALLY